MPNRLHLHVASPERSAWRRLRIRVTRTSVRNYAVNSTSTGLAATGRSLAHADMGAVGADRCYERGGSGQNCDVPTPTVGLEVDNPHIVGGCAEATDEDAPNAGYWGV